jgi:homogentisate 1,2-dioxygenase
MFESTYFMRVTKWASDTCATDKNYYKCWAGLKDEFKAPPSK